MAKSYPELVSYGDDGKPQTVRYLELSAMLLNELQKQTTENQRQAAQIRQLTMRAEQQANQMAQLKNIFEQALAAQSGTRSVTAAVFDRSCWCRWILPIIHRFYLAGPS